MILLLIVCVKLDVKDFQWELPFKEDCLPTKIIDPIPCPHCNYVFYCSETCRRSAWDQYHEVFIMSHNYLTKFDLGEIQQVMCPKKVVGPDDPYVLFEQHSFKYCDNV